MNEELGPDERALRAVLASSKFGREVGRRWSVACLDGTKLILAISAPPVPGAPDHYWIRLDCQDYPERGPTGTFWDVENDRHLEHAKRPWGTGRLALVFRVDWAGPDGVKGGTFYHPCDRGALETHSDWPTKIPRKCWSADKGLVYYLDEIYGLLNSELYTGIRGAIP